MFRRKFQQNKISVRVKDDCKTDFKTAFQAIDGVVQVEQVYPSVKELAGIYLLIIRESYADWVKEQVKKIDNIEFCADLSL